MAKYLQINIKESCGESWNDMLPNNQGRHCASCQKTVVDFTGMTDTELISFFTKQKGNLCGRFSNEQLQRDILIPKKKTHWMKYFFQIALPAFFLSSKVAAQTDTTKCATEIRDTSKQFLQIDTLTTVQPLTDSTKLTEAIDSIVSDSAFTFPEFKLEPSISTIEIINPTTLGYSTIEVMGDINIESKINPDTSLFSGILGKIFKKNTPLSIPLNLPNVPPPIVATLFPNPIKSGTVLHINWEHADAGDYHFIITNSNGGIVQTGSFHLAEKAESSSITLKDLPSSNYTLVITHVKSAKKITQQFIVF